MVEQCHRLHSRLVLQGITAAAVNQCLGQGILFVARFTGLSKYPPANSHHSPLRTNRVHAITTPTVRHKRYI